MYVVLTGYSMKDDLKDHFKLPVSVTAFFYLFNFSAS